MAAASGPPQLPLCQNEEERKKARGYEAVAGSWSSIALSWRSECLKDGMAARDFGSCFWPGRWPPVIALALPSLFQSVDSQRHEATGEHYFRLVQTHSSATIGDVCRLKNNADVDAICHWRAKAGFQAPDLWMACEFKPQAAHRWHPAFSAFGRWPTSSLQLTWRWHCANFHYLKTQFPSLHCRCSCSRNQLPSARPYRA